MIYEIRELVDQYWLWLRDRTSVRELNDWVEITTPYLDRHNDYLQIYAAASNGGIRLTDDGYVLEDLKQSGVTFDTPRRRALLDMTLNGFGVRNDGTALEVRASEANFCIQKHNLVQAMLAVNDLFCLASPRVTSVFLEDVIAWLDSSGVRYIPKVKLTGSSGFDHVFDYVIPKSRKRPERVVRSLNQPDRQAAQTMVFSWIDTKEARPAESSAYAILNDVERPVPQGVSDAMLSYGIHPVLWSTREEALSELAA